MKIEKVNDNQIRCTLNSSDLHSRSLTLSDLAYGNKKAKSLFAEMMRMADAQFGFRPDDHPIMVEAVPLSSGGLMLMISRVEDPDELDTRFAKFAPGMEEVPEGKEMSAHRKNDLTADLMETLENFLKLGEALESETSSTSETKDRSSDSTEASGEENKVNTGEGKPSEKAAEDTAKKPSKQEPTMPLRLFFVYAFKNLDTVIRAAHALKGVYEGNNSLFKSEEDHRYYLVVHRSGHSPETFNKVCNVLTEYSDRVVSTAGSESYFMEHLELLTGPTALQDLAQV